MEKEILACIADNNIRFLHSGQIAKYIFPVEREEAHEKKISHLITRLFVVSITPEKKIQYLVQKRGKNKKSFPEYFTDSASGHVVYKRNLTMRNIEDEAKRELEEEFGIPPIAIDKLLFYDLNKEENKNTTEIAYVFLGLVKNIVQLKPNPNELQISESRFYTQSELTKLLQNEKTIDYAKTIWKKLLNTDLVTKFKVNNNHPKLTGLKRNVALFIGRFQPLHHGHIYVLNKIFKSYKKIKIGIGSSQLSKTKTDPFTNEERVSFINSALKERNINPDRFEIFAIPDIFNANKWVDHVISIVGDFDTVFSNSEWVRQLFQNNRFIIGEKLEIFKKKYNATNVRNLISKENRNWTVLVPKEVANLIKGYDGIQRIKSLYEKGD